MLILLCLKNKAHNKKRLPTVNVKEKIILYRPEIGKKKTSFFAVTG